MRDAYGTAAELPHMTKRASGEHDDLEWLQGWCATLREHVQDGRSVRRARVVSEPLSDYQRWSYTIAVSDGGGRGGYPVGAPQPRLVGRAAGERFLPVR